MQISPLDILMHNVREKSTWKTESPIEWVMYLVQMTKGKACLNIINLEIRLKTS